MSDPFDLARFVTAQDAVWPAVREELAEGRKRTHWMWFVFPQLAVLGRSATARRYGLSGRAEARAYLGHPVLGPRLAEVTGLALHIGDRDLRAIFWTPDDLKFRSSMTLFATVADGPSGTERAGTPSPYRLALERFCGGRPDPLTLDALGDGDGRIIAGADDPGPG